jgi:hypothetical protein
VLGVPISTITDFSGATEDCMWVATIA